MPAPLQTPFTRFLTAPAARRWLGFLALVAIGVWTFQPALRGEWLWDDNSEITSNPVLRDPAGWWKAWVVPATPDYQPLKTTLQWIEWRCWGERTTVGYHAVTLSLHLLGAALVWVVLRRLGVRFAWFGGVLFAVHPVVVESVAWLAELKNTLSLPLLLAAALAWLAFEERKRAGTYAAALGWFVLALLAKASVVMFPLVLLLHAWWRRGRVTRRDAMEAAPFFAASLAAGCVTLWFQAHRAIGADAVAASGFGGRLIDAGRALWFYAGHAVAPTRLGPVYPQWPAGGAAWEWLPPLAAGVAGAFALWRCPVEARRGALFALGFFVLGLAPALGIADMSYLRIAPVADHFAYVALIGPVGLAVALAGVVARWSGGARVVVTGLLGLAVLLCAVESRRYAAAFQSAKALWTRAVEVNPESPVAHNNLGVSLLARGATATAAGHFEAAVRLNPEYAEAHVNLGNALAALDRPDEAIAHYARAVQLDADSFEAEFGWGNVLATHGRPAEAVGHYRAALRISPEAGDAQLNLGNALVEAGRVGESLDAFAAAVRVRPESVPARLNFGIVLAGTGRLREAIEQFREAVRLAPDSEEARGCLADALREAGR